MSVDDGSREQSHTDHLREVARYLRWRLPEEFQWRELDEFLFVLAQTRSVRSRCFRAAYYRYRDPEVSFADRSFQYCPTCQTGGRLLADRRRSRLVK